VTKSPLKLGFLASRNGTSARAIVTAIQGGGLQAEARLMVSNNRTAPALAWAEATGLAAVCIPTAADPAAADARLAEALTAAGVELVVLSGYLRQLGPVSLERFAGRILNVHPGLLPAFGGPGMYGRRVHEAVLAAGEKRSGASIHVVDEEYDHGPVVAQRAVPVLAGDTAEALEARVTAVEPALFIETLRRIAAGDLVLPLGERRL
jgi:phosphoribosylglycinamide formyltransferase-1